MIAYGWNNLVFDFDFYYISQSSSAPCCLVYLLSSGFDVSLKRPGAFVLVDSLGAWIGCGIWMALLIWLLSEYQIANLLIEILFSMNLIHRYCLYEYNLTDNFN